MPHMKPEDARRIVERLVRRAKNERPRGASEALLQSGGFQIVHEPTKG